jgi:hypothetical protein
MADSFGTKRQRENEVENRERETTSRNLGVTSSSQASPDYPGKQNPSFAVSGSSFSSQSRTGSFGKSQHADGGLDHDRIARRAYELYELRGRENGHELEDWLRAEREVARQK